MRPFFCFKINNGDSVYNKAVYGVDVVPYITGLDTWIGKNTQKLYARSAFGYYDVRAGETITINGFNLKKDATTNPSVSINGQTSYFTVSTTATDVTVNSVKGTVNSSAISGPLVITVNGVASLNNSNTNPTLPIGETEPTGVVYNGNTDFAHNHRLTDDVQLHVWSLGNFVGKTNITGPMMKMDSAGNYYMIYDNNTNGTSTGEFRLVQDTNGNAVQVDGGYNKWVHSALAVDGQGRIFGVSTNSDRTTDEAARFKFYPPRNASGSFSRSSYYGNDDARRSLEQVYNSTTKFYDIDRISRPKMFAQGTSGASKIYLAYYDQNHTEGPVKFRYGTAGTVTVTSNRISCNVSGGIAGNTSGTTQSGSAVTTSTGSAANFHVIADSTMTYQGGAYTAVGATSGGVAVVAWYDATRNALIYSYNTTPNTPVYGGAWQTNAIVIDDDYAGWYVDLFVDSKDGIHIAYYSSSAGDLRYAYLPAYNSTGTAIKKANVDTYLSTGTNITIETRDETVSGKSYIVPYISYYQAAYSQSPSSIRVAYMPESILVSGTTVTANIGDGAIDDKFTGKWEVASVPTPNVPVEAQVCIGLPATSNTTYKGSPVLGFKSDKLGYEKAYIKY